MNRTLTAFGMSVLLGGSLLLGSAPAQAIDMPACPPATHLVMDPGSSVSGTCVHDPQPAPTAPILCSHDGITCVWDGQPPVVSGPPPVQPPPYKPLAAPAAPEVPGRVIQVPAGEARPGSAVAGGDRSSGPNWAPAGAAEAPAGETLQSQTPVDGQVPVEAPAKAAPAPAAVMPVTEVQAVDVLRSATATEAEKKAALVIVKARIEAVLSKALDSALARR